MTQTKEEQFLMEFCKEIIRPGAEMERKAALAKYAKLLTVMLDEASVHQIEVKVAS